MSDNDNGLSRDLSTKFGDGGYLEVEIEGKGVSRTKFETPAPLSAHAQVAFLFLTSEDVEVKDPKNAPWYLISFDRGARRLVVRKV